MKIKFIISFIFLSILVFGQEINWKNLDNNNSLFYSVLSEGSKEEIQDHDEVQFVVYQFEFGRVLVEDDFAAGENLTISIFKELKNEFNTKIDIKFLKSSEYLIRWDEISNNLILQISLTENLSEKDLKKLDKNLTKEFGEKNTKYTSSVDATKLAKEQFGENVIFLADNVFPANFEIKIPKNSKNFSKINQWIDTNKENKNISNLNFSEANSITWVLKIST